MGMEKEWEELKVWLKSPKRLDFFVISDDAEAVINKMSELELLSLPERVADLTKRVDIQKVWQATRNEATTEFFGKIVAAALRTGDLSELQKLVK